MGIPDIETKACLLNLKELPDQVKRVLPESRERALVITKLQEARMWFENAPKFFLDTEGEDL